MLDIQSLFNPQTVPLTGINLIEASAGTGKTWNIAALFIRLLIDESNGKPATIEQILVVTFTKAASAELKSRLRKRLTEALFAINNQDYNDDFLAELLKPYQEDDALLTRTCLRLKTAINNFDLAAIYTIHGFCQRVLVESAFASAQSFNCEQIKDDDSTLLQLTNDFWRKNIIYNPINAAIVAKEKSSNPQSWLKEIKSFLAKPYLNKIPPKQNQIQGLINKRNLAWQALYDFKDFDGGYNLFLDSFTVLNKRTYKKETYIKLFEWLILSLQHNLSPQLQENKRKYLLNLTPEKLSKNTNKYGTTPKHDLFELIEKWLDADRLYNTAENDQLISLKFALIDWLNSESGKLRHLLRQRSFDDLLLDLYSALNTSLHGEELAKLVSSTWTVALIDEFQDTDPLQYSIFSKIFARDGCCLFLVGDPKQAIYSFRGADIFAYLSARDAASQRFTLNANYRSVPALVAGVNSLFARKNAFLLDIPYQPISTAAKCATLHDSYAAKPFCWRWFSLEKSTKDNAQQLVAEQCASDIADLLNRAQNAEVYLQQADTQRSINGGDIALIVASHRQAELLQKTLIAHGISSVYLTQSSVWASNEAAELLTIMRAWCHPDDERFLRLALSSELIGLDAADIYALDKNQAKFAKYQAAFLLERKLCLTQGFMAAWRKCFAINQIAERLLPMLDGERRLTNLTHLCELITQMATEKRSLEALLLWFEKCVADPPLNEESLMRIESEQTLVNILTIHASKGLQYPIVYLPFLWSAPTKASQANFFSFHQNQAVYLIAKTMCDAAQSLQIDEEQFAEKIRLLYVALTRAEQRLYVYWLPVSGMENAALSWLLHADSCSTVAELNELCKEKIKTPDKLLADLQKLVDENPEHMTLQLVKPSYSQLFSPVTATHPAINLRQFKRRLFNSWRVTSFSALKSTYALPKKEEFELVLDLIEQDEILVENKNLFPRGTHAGNCLHLILQHIDFTADFSRIRAVAEQVLPSFAFSEEAQLDAACQLLDATLNSPIDSGFCLANISLNDRVSELQFYLPLSVLQVEKLREILADEQNGLPLACRIAAKKLEFKTVQGYLTGFIDLIIRHKGRFYLIDYKSNYLGDSFLDYSATKLALIIAESHYYLQYLIYCVAFRRYLISRNIDYAEVFSGVRYLFMRGMDKQGNGIWIDTPDMKLIMRLDALFSA